MLIVARNACLSLQLLLISLKCHVEAFGDIRHHPILSILFLVKMYNNHSGMGNFYVISLYAIDNHVEARCLRVDNFKKSMHCKLLSLTCELLGSK